MRLIEHLKKSQGRYFLAGSVIVAALTLLIVFDRVLPAGPAPGGLALTDAAILGVVEGITEYLPVSSTGHLLFTQRVLGLADTEQAKAVADSYAVIIQFGAILAVLGLYRNRVVQIVRGAFGRDRSGLTIAINLAAAFLPAALAGLLLHSFIKQFLFGPWPVIAAWAAGGVLLLRWRGADARGSALNVLENVTINQALLIGLFQCLALWPGMSRSLATIVGGVIVGLPLACAVEFSFLLGGVTLGAATVFELYANGHAVLDRYDPAIAIFGLLCSLVSAAIAIRWLVGFLQERDMAMFGYYRLAIPMLAGGYLLWG